MDSRLSPCVYPSPFSLLLHLMSFSLKSHSYIFPPAQKLTTHKAKLSWLGNHGYGRLRLVAFSFCEIDNELSTRRTMGHSSYSMYEATFAPRRYLSCTECLILLGNSLPITKLHSNFAQLVHCNHSRVGIPHAELLFTETVSTSWNRN